LRVEGVSGLALLAIIAVPVVLVLLYLRRPVGRVSVPRDSMAMLGKSKSRRSLGVMPNDAFDDTIIDEASDLPDEPRANAGEQHPFDTEPR
jgi:hypothetical protein